MNERMNERMNNKSFLSLLFLFSKSFRKETRTAVVLKVSEMRRGGSINILKCSLMNTFDIALEFF